MMNRRRLKLVAIVRAPRGTAAPGLGPGFDSTACLEGKMGTTQGARQASATKGPRTMALVASMAMVFTPAHLWADEPSVVVASASTSTAKQHLGRPFNAKFEPLIGEEGKSLFPRGRIVEHKRTGEMGVDWIEITNSSELAANAAGWNGIVQGRASKSAGKRYVAYRAYQLTHIIELDDT